MKTFLAVYTGQFGEMSEWNKLGETERKEREQKGMQAWGAWQEAHGARITVAGGPLGKTKIVDKNGITDKTNSLCGFVILKAESQEEAASLFKEHPHFSIFPGDAVEIMEILPIPGG